MLILWSWLAATILGGIVYWVRTNFWIPFGSDFILFDGHLRVRNAYYPSFKAALHIYFFAFAIVTLLLFLFKEKIPFALIQLLGLFACLSIIVFAALLILVPFIARISSSAVVYSDAIELKPFWGESLRLDAACIDSVRFSEFEGESVFVSLRHLDNCSCSQGFYQFLFRKFYFETSKCKIDASYSPFSLSVFANMIASGEINQHLPYEQEGVVVSSWGCRTSFCDEQKSYLENSQQSRKEEFDEEEFLDRELAPAPNFSWRLGLVISLVITSFVGLFILLQTCGVSLWQNFVVRGDELLVRLAYQSYWGFGLIFGIASIVIFLVIYGHLSSKQWGISGHLSAVAYSLLFSLMLFLGLFGPHVFTSLKSSSSGVELIISWDDDKVIFDRDCLTLVEVGEKPEVYVHLSHKKNCDCFTKVRKRKATVKVPLTGTSCLIDARYFPFDVGVYACAIASGNIDMSYTGMRNFTLNCR
jgi:hypothetical protein